MSLGVVASHARSVRAYIALGSNLKDPVAQIKIALESINSLAQTANFVSSSFYRNPPMGPSDQPNFVNAVVGFDTSLEPQDLLEALLAIETDQGRVRTAQRWGPRVIDLDILLFGDCQINKEHLTIPHPGLCERVFVLLPLYEIAPALVFPSGKHLSVIMASADTSSLVRIEV